MRLIKQYIAATALGLSLSGASAMAEVVAVVSAKSQITSLSQNQVADIFLGKVHRFPSGETATPIDQVEDSPLRLEFHATFTRKSPAQLKAHWAKIIFTGRGRPPREVADSAGLKKLLAENPAAIGYLDKSELDAGIRALTILP